MTTAQLGPPPVAAGRGGAAPPGTVAQDGATGALVESADGSFVAVLDGQAAPAAPDATGQAQTPTAAGPLAGELPTEAVADADASPETTVAPADVAAVIAAAVTGAAPAAAAAGASATPAATVTAGATAGSPPSAAPAQPLPGLVPAVLDGDGAVAPAPAPVPVAPAASAAQAASAAPAAASAGTTPAAPPAATVTLTLSAAPSDAAAVPVAAASAAAPAPEAPAAAAPVRPAGQDAAAGVPKAADAPAGIALASAAPAVPHADPLEGLVRGGGLTTPFELARELGHRVQMAVREGGRELVLNLRPPELGHLTIRVTMTEGVLHAQIVADRPEAARLLQQSLAQLDASLGDLGWSLDSLDVALGGGEDPRDAFAASRGHDARAGGEVGDADSAPAAVVDPSTPAAGATAGRLDLLA